MTPGREPLPPLTEVRHRQTGEAGVVAIDLGDNVSVWVGERDTELWARSDVEVVREPPRRS